MAPGAPAAHAPGPGHRSTWIAGRRVGVVGGIEPVGAPLVTDAGQIGETEWVGRGAADLRGPREAEIGPRVAPGKPRIDQSTAGRLLPFRLGRQSRTRPRREGACLVPGQSDHRLLWVGEVGLAPEAG